jgi:hypothetical protein
MHPVQGLDLDLGHCRGRRAQPTRVEAALPQARPLACIACIQDTPRAKPCFKCALTSANHCKSLHGPCSTSETGSPSRRQLCPLVGTPTGGSVQLPAPSWYAHVIVQAHDTSVSFA